MSDRYFDYDPNEECECCGAIGAYDVYGDFYCSYCLQLYQEQNNGPDGFFG